MTLYLVAIVVVILTLGAYALLSFSMSEREATQLRGNEIQLNQVANSGVDMIRATLAFSPEMQEQLGGISSNPEYFSNVPVISETNSPRYRGAARFTVVSPVIKEQRFAGIRYGLLDESARLHLGTVLRWETENPGQGARSLMRLPGMTPSIADSILDWIDDDKTARPSGAELEYYQRIGAPYGPRNAVPPSLEELLLVRDFTRKLLFGTDEHLAYKPEPQSRVSQYGASEIELPWAYLLTTLSAEKEVDPKGEAKLDLNEPNLEFLHRQLSDTVGPDAADFVILYRQYGPMNSTLENSSSGSGTVASQISQTRPRNSTPLLATGTGMRTRRGGGNMRFRGMGSTSDIVDFSIPAKFRIECPLDLLDVVVKQENAGNPDIPGTLDVDQTSGNEISSPFGVDSEDKAELFLVLLDYATSSTSVVIPGRININEASRDVLRAIPGLSESEAEKILSERKPEPEFRHTFWLLRNGILDRDKLKRLWPDITTRGDVYRAQVVGFYEKLGTNARFEVVIDSTVLPPRQVYFKDLSIYGKGFSDEILQGKGSSVSSGGALDFSENSSGRLSGTFDPMQFSPSPGEEIPIPEPDEKDPGSIEFHFSDDPFF